jgi:hypothetical protein
MGIVIITPDGLIWLEFCEQGEKAKPFYTCGSGSRKVKSSSRETRYTKEYKIIKEMFSDML